ncbi:hypothetical protein BV25DRAFT_355193 [Artomyces pyxidatus]|uniref:Uncharacterized protein n=1 Tax=Artomyces pyxidatus TaxID=48021 RepID=A0ACB8T5G0_9AGAM|nr:hypothetical protein BV25DRAFT_355193 [Artomyces pyxidatus]
MNEREKPPTAAGGSWVTGDRGTRLRYTPPAVRLGLEYPRHAHSAQNNRRPSAHPRNYPPQRASVALRDKAAKGRLRYGVGRSLGSRGARTRSDVWGGGIKQENDCIRDDIGVRARPLTRPSEEGRLPPEAQRPRACTREAPGICASRAGAARAYVTRRGAQKPI